MRYFYKIVQTVVSKLMRWFRVIEFTLGAVCVGLFTVQNTLVCGIFFLCGGCIGIEAVVRNHGKIVHATVEEEMKFGEYYQLIAWIVLLMAWIALGVIGWVNWYLTRMVCFAVEQALMQKAKRRNEENVPVYFFPLLFQVLTTQDRDDHIPLQVAAGLSLPKLSRFYMYCAACWFVISYLSGSAYILWHRVMWSSPTKPGPGHVAVTAINFVWNAGLTVYLFFAVGCLTDRVDVHLKVWRLRWYCNIALTALVWITSRVIWHFSVDK